MHQQDLHKQPVYCNMPYAIILPYSNISLEILPKLSKTWKHIPYIPGLYEFFATKRLPRAPSLCFCVTKHMQFSKPVDKWVVGGEMSSIHIRHVLSARIGTLFYNGAVYLSTFKANQNK